MMAKKMHTGEVKALKAILSAEHAWQTFSNIKQLLENHQLPFTQIDILSDPNTDPQHLTTLTNKTDVEAVLLQRNQRHSRQSLHTPFFMNPILRDAINPNSPSSLLDNLFEGNFPEELLQDFPVSDIEMEWIRMLKGIVMDEIPLTSSHQEFRSFFCQKQEGTASSPSGQHMGDYKMMLKCIRHDNPILPKSLSTLLKLHYLLCLLFDNGHPPLKL
jgi:hypothetical protein